MNEKRFTMKGSTILENGEEITAWDCCDLLNELSDENEQLKQQLQEEQCRTTPITLTTHISDNDFKKIELMLKKYFGDLE